MAKKDRLTNPDRKVKTCKTCNGDRCADCQYKGYIIQK